MPPRYYDLANFGAEREHARARSELRGMMTELDHPEALRALRKVETILKMLCASLWDGVQGLEPGRIAQGQIDATVMADFGEAIRSHCEGHGG